MDNYNLLKDAAEKLTVSVQALTFKEVDKRKSKLLHKVRALPAVQRVTTTHDGQIVAFLNPTRGQSTPQVLYVENPDDPFQLGLSQPGSDPSGVCWIGFNHRVIENTDVSDPFPVTNDVKRGCVLAPTLFILLFAEMLSAALDKTSGGTTIRYRTDGR
ncbi:hypothetical protein ACOMHN_058238 [Nucella lapillus]